MGRIAPTLEFPPLIPFTDQVTVEGKFPAPETVAVKTCAPLAGTDAPLGKTLTCRPSVIATVADALLCGAA